MIDNPPSIELFCSEFSRLAEIVDVPADYISGCVVTQNVQGLRISVTPDGGRYVLTYKEKYDVHTVAESADRDIVLEHAFIDITGNMAASQMSNVNSEDALFVDPNLSTDELKQMAVQHHLQLSAEQEKLLGRINRDWQKRQAVRNVQQLTLIEKFFEK
ncbi:MAG: hypothetical protein AAGC58_00505 [Asticcacaulis sp.]